MDNSNDGTSQERMIHVGRQLLLQMAQVVCDTRLIDLMQDGMTIGEARKLRATCEKIVADLDDPAARYFRDIMGGF
jgi:hypothetical protein